jgi:hypothetical protein
VNKKGQSSIVFIILIPIIFIILAFIYDNALIIIENNRYKAMTNSIIKDVLTNSYYDKAEEVKNLYEENNYETDQLDARYEDDILYVYNVHSYNSFFGYILGIKSYRTEISVYGYKENDDIIIEEYNEE